MVRDKIISRRKVLNKYIPVVMHRSWTVDLGSISKQGCSTRFISVQKFAAGPMASIIGLRKTEYACQTGKLFTGEEALDWGLIDQLVSAEGK